MFLSSCPFYVLAIYKKKNPGKDESVLCCKYNELVTTEPTFILSSKRDKLHGFSPKNLKGKQRFIFFFFILMECILEKKFISLFE